MPPSLEREDDGDRGEHDDGEDAVPEDGDDDGDGDGRHGHEGEEAVHGEAAQHADPVDVVEVDLAHQQQQRPERLLGRNNFSLGLYEIIR